MSFKKTIEDFKKDKILYEYIQETIKNAYFGKLDTMNQPALELIEKHFFDGWCWEASNLLSIFFKETDLVQRGCLILPQYPIYSHGWIEFVFNNNKYVFDPALIFLGFKEEYEQRFKPEYNCSIFVKQIKNDLISLINNNEDVKNLYPLLPYSKGIKKVWINPSMNIKDSFYITKALVCAETKNDKILKLNAHLYIPDNYT